MRLGELLVMNGLITESQLEEAIRVQADTKKKLGHILVERGWITERQLVEVLEFQLGFPVVNLQETPPDLQAVKRVSEELAKKHCVIPVDCKHGKLKLAMEDPLNYEAIEEIRMATGMNIQPVIAVRSDIEQAIIRYYGMKKLEQWLDLEESGGAADADAEDESLLAADSPIVKLVDQIIRAAVQRQASDIHIDPQERQVVVKYRIDGVLYTERALPKHLQDALTTRLKILAKLNIAERRLPQDGRIQMQVDGRRIDIRLSTLPTVYGESIVLRLLDQSAGIKKLSELGLSEDNFSVFSKVIRKPNGIILISGPTGSGKTSTLYSVLNEINSDELKIITIEDPVEYRLPGITQVQVNAQIGLTFASGLRSILRQDPDIVMVGEIRDVETAEIAVRASLTGHLVLSTIHTNSAVATITRLVDMGVDPYLIASSLVCVVAQRLVRRVCRECGQQVAAKPEEIRLFEAHGLVSAEAKNAAGGRGVGLSFVHQPATVWRGKGCSSCNKSGYRGRIAIHEVLTVDEPLRRMIAQNRPVDEMRRYLSEQGYRTMLFDGLSKARFGLTTVEEVLRAVAED